MSARQSIPALVRNPAACHRLKYGLQAGKTIAQLSPGRLMIGHIGPDAELRKVSNKPAEQLLVSADGQSRRRLVQLAGEIDALPVAELIPCG